MYAGSTKLAWYPFNSPLNTSADINATAAASNITFDSVCTCFNYTNLTLTASLAEFLQFQGLNVTCATDDVSSNVLPIRGFYIRGMI